MTISAQTRRDILERQSQAARLCRPPDSCPEPVQERPPRPTLPPPACPPQNAALSGRERQLLAAWAAGHTTREIAAHWRLSLGTVTGYATTLRYKLGAGTQAHAVALGFRAGLLT